MLAEAREEVAVLARRRDAITGELGQLSGVIQALAVSESPDEVAPEAVRASDPDIPAETPDEQDLRS